MISFIRGTVADLTENSAIIESNCIGFEINMTGNALAQLHIGQEVKLHTYFQVREDAMVLYGFFNKDDLQVFKLLLGVNGVGPKAALGVLAGITADELRFAVLSDDVKTLSKAPGIGKKTAQRIVLELKDKVAKLSISGTEVSGEEMLTEPISDHDAIEALCQLGYTKGEAKKAVVKILCDDPAIDNDNLLRKALTMLSKF